MPNLFNSTNYPENEPSELIIGDRWSWKRTDLATDYDPASYTLKYSLRLQSSGATEIEITATDGGSAFLVEVAAATTGTYTAGTYQWQAYITRNSDSERITVEQGTVDIVADRDASTTDPRSHAKKVLDAIEAVIEDRATKDQMSYSINGRTLSRTPIAELLVLRDRYRTDVERELNAEKLKAGEDIGGTILTRF